MSILWFGCVLIAILAFDIATDVLFDYIGRTYEEDRSNLATQLKTLKRGEHLTVEWKTVSVSIEKRANRGTGNDFALHIEEVEHAPDGLLFGLIYGQTLDKNLNLKFNISKARKYAGRFMLGLVPGIPFGTALWAVLRVMGHG